MNFPADDPVSGCEQYPRATECAAQLLALHWGDAREHMGEKAHRVSLAQNVLAVLLHAAALGGVGINQVRAWMADPDAAQEQIEHCLRRSPEANHRWSALYYLMKSAPERTRTTIHDTIWPVLNI